MARSKTAAAVALVKGGMRPVDAAREVGIARSGLSRALANEPEIIEAGRRMDRLGNRIRVMVPMRRLDALEAAARRRGMTASMLLQRIVDTVIDHKLIDAVLDDA